MKVGFAQGVQLGTAEVRGWETYVLLDVSDNGWKRPIAFLDEDALTRLHEQTGAALAQLHGSAAPPHDAPSPLTS